MKQLLLIFTGAILLSSCNEKKKTASSDAGTDKTTTSTTTSAEKVAGKTASFTIDGKSFSGEVTTQYFGDKETKPFSVICQQEEPLATLQIVFANEKDALTDQSFSTVNS